MGQRPPELPRPRGRVLRRSTVAIVCVLVIVIVAVPVLFLGAIRLASGMGETYARKSPFSAVRWDESQPEVRVDGNWFKLVSMDDVPASEIVAFSRETYGNLWKKRFEEDLVELLTRMGHPPGDTATLVVQPLDSSETKTLRDVPLTTANRQAIRRAALERRPERYVPLAEQVPALRREKDLVGLAAMVVVDGEVVASAVDGERKKGSGVSLTLDDRWHLGSITKSITATMIARLVESGRMDWSDTVGKYFPEPSVHPNWKPVALDDLLTHTSGAPANFSFLSPRQRPALGPERSQARREAVLKVIADKPSNPPGAAFAYSNVGYTLAGTLAEEATGDTWEDLVTREVFEPLGLTSAGFGPPPSPDDTLAEPRGHRTLFGWKLAVDDTADNTPIIGPAGIVHMTLRDLCTYAEEHLRGELGRGALLSAESYRRLHTPRRDDYAYGWGLKESDGSAPHTLYWHNGSNTMWYALVVFVPDLKLVVAVASNDGDMSSAEAAAWEIVQSTLNRPDAEARSE